MDSDLSKGRFDFPNVYNVMITWNESVKTNEQIKYYLTYADRKIKFLHNFHFLTTLLITCNRKGIGFRPNK